MRQRAFISRLGGTAAVWSSHDKRAPARMRELLLLIIFSLLALAAAQQAPAQNAPGGLTRDPRNSICLMIESAARANALPIDFFARVIWQESRFRANVIGPVTRSGERAQGIAQFMPGTAAERRLFEPFNPAEALVKSAEFLAELRNQFGNLGFVAAAYNASPERVREFIRGSRDLPLQTRNYVVSITGRSIEDWAKAATGQPNEEIGEPHANDVTASCRDLILLYKQAPDLIIAELQQRRAPSWCKHLHHPNVNVCGSVHQEEARKILRASSH